MKRLIVILFLFCVFINSYQAFNFKDCIKEITVDDLNSKNLLEYIKDNELVDKIFQVCSNDFCHKINPSDLERDIKEFIKQNLDLVAEKDVEQGLEAELKGFRIDRIKINNW